MAATAGATAAAVAAVTTAAAAAAGQLYAFDDIHITQKLLQISCYCGCFVPTVISRSCQARNLRLTLRPHARLYDKSHCSV